MLDAWRTIDRDAVLWIGGAGPQTEELRAEKKVKNVEWLGAITDAERDSRLRGATVLCAPSLHGESFGVVLLEGMAAGTPVVASAIEGYRNVARADRDALAGPARRCGRAAASAATGVGRSGVARATGGRRPRPSRGILDGTPGRALLELYERALVPAR